MSSQSAQELQDDIDELQVLISASSRPNVAALLRSQLVKLESQLAALKKAAAAAAAASAAAASAAAAPVPAAPSAPAVVWTNISKYAFEAGDYSSKKVTIYITLASVGSLPKESVKVEFAKRSLDLQVVGLDGANHRLLVPYLDKEIVPGECTHRISKDSLVGHGGSNKLTFAGRITITLKAKDSGVWSKLAGDKPAPGEKSAEDDPGASLMNMMKKMYDEGDDTMKKTIGEAMLKSRMGGGAGAPGGATDCP